MLRSLFSRFQSGDSRKLKAEGALSNARKVRLALDQALADGVDTFTLTYRANTRTVYLLHWLPAWLLTDNALPEGIRLGTSDGTLWGIPVRTEDGLSDLMCELVSEDGSWSQTFELQHEPPPPKSAPGYSTFMR